MAQTKLNEEQVDLTNYKKAAQTTAEISAAVQTHNTDGSAHADIRTKIGTDIAAHNTSTSAHADIRSTLAGKAEQTALAAHTARTDNPHAVTKVQVGLGNVDNTADADKPVSAAAQAALDLKANAAETQASLALKADSADVDADISDINAALERKQDDGDFHPEDYGWPDIRPAARPNAIVLLAGVASDYSAYDNLGFAATCEGGYNVFIDGVQYGDTYASGAQCSITWSQYSATAGFPVTQPQALTAHIVQIVPAVYGNSITAFLTRKYPDSTSRQAQGVLWVHFNTHSAIKLTCLLQNYNNYYQPLCLAITSSQKELNVSIINIMSGGEEDITKHRYAKLAYVPIFNFGGAKESGRASFNSRGTLKKIHLKNGGFTDLQSCFANQNHLKRIELDDFQLKSENKKAIYCFFENLSLQELPAFDLTDATDCSNFLTKAKMLKDTYLDFSYCHKMTALGIYGDSNYPIRGLKNLLLSLFAPFTGTSPQINVAYTGLDQNALAELFNSLPYNVGYTVVGSPTIQTGSVTGFSLNDYVTIPKMPAVSLADTLEIVFDVTTNGNFSNTEMLLISGNWGQIYQNWNRMMGGYFNSQYISGNIALENGSRHTVKYKFENGTLSIFVDDELDVSADIGAISKGSQASIGARAGTNYFGGTIHTAGSYITYNGLPYFNWAAAMDKTINITGATGAASLTAEQLAIATDKGWTVTR